MILYLKDIKNVDAGEKEVIEALRKSNPEMIVVSEDDPDPDLFLTVRVRASKADNLIEHIKGLGYSCKKFDLA